VLFLIEYDRSSATTLKLLEYQDQERAAAQTARLERELDINRANVDHEVVLLEASNLDALRKTHARYFDDIETMISRLEHTATSTVGPRSGK
jgi:hypothetical protein